MDAASERRVVPDGTRPCGGDRSEIRAEAQGNAGGAWAADVDPEERAAHERPRAEKASRAITSARFAT